MNKSITTCSCYCLVVRASLYNDLNDAEIIFKMGHYHYFGHVLLLWPLSPQFPQTLFFSCFLLTELS